jgi:predicted metal-dependent hydrolase
MAGRVEETRAEIALPSGPLAYVLRRHPRSRGLRLTVDPRLGLVVSVPLASRRGWARPESLVTGFLRDREPWIRRHLARLERDRAAARARGGPADGGTVRYLGQAHRVRVIPAAPGVARSTVSREGADAGDELVVRVARRDRRAVPIVLEHWLRERAQEAIERAIAGHAPALKVAPARVSLRDPRTRWGSASRSGTLSFSWRLVLAPPEALETVVIHELAHLRVFGHGSRFWELVARRRPDHADWRRWLRRHSHELHDALGD